MTRQFLSLSLLLSLMLCLSPAGRAEGDPAKAPSGGFDNLLLSDDFEREESDDSKEEIGNDWSTNSKSRAQGEKQVDLDAGAMHVTRAEVADHGVSVVHDLDFKDAVIRLRFKLGAQDDLGINIADMQEKSVHAGHLCMARIRLNKTEIADLKTGRMKLEHRDQLKAKTETPELKKLIKSKSKYFDTKLAADEWHQLEVRIEGETMTVKIDDQPVGEFQSPGIGHPTKRRLRLAVNKSAWIDDVNIWSKSKTKTD